MFLVNIDLSRYDRETQTQTRIGRLSPRLNAICGSHLSGKSSITRFLADYLFRYSKTYAAGDPFLRATITSTDQVIAETADHESLPWPSGRDDDRSDAGVTDIRYSNRGRYDSRTVHESELSWQPNSLQPHPSLNSVSREFLTAVFCGRLGEVHPNLLAKAARQLHMASSSLHEPLVHRDVDVYYTRLRLELKELTERQTSDSGNVRNNSHEWMLERDRLIARLAQLEQSPAANDVGETQLRRWRMTLSEIRGHRQQLERSAADIRAYRVDNGRVADGVSKRNREALENQILKTRRSLDTILQSCDVPAHKLHPLEISLPVTLRSMQNDLYEVYQQLTRHEPEAALSQLVAQIGQLKRCESELQESIEAQYRRHDPVEWDLVRSQLRDVEAMIDQSSRQFDGSRRIAEIEELLRGRLPNRESVDDSLTIAAERYLRELSGGRHTQLSTLANEAHPHIHQWIDLAIRLAIADAAVARLGRIPLVLDDAFESMRGEDLDRTLRILEGYTRNGQQIILLTSDAEVASRVRAHQGRVWMLREAAPIEDAIQVVTNRNRSLPETDEIIYSDPRRSLVHEWSSPRYDPNSVDINRQLTGYANEYEAEAWLGSPVFRQPLPAQPTTPAARTRSAAARKSPFFLTEQSPIADAPSIDSQTAAHLCALGIHTVGQLLLADARYLADQANIPGITVESVVRWQAECNLVCRVPRLRGFDARLLVGCGVTNPNQLSSIPRGQLLQRVESFLATDQGRGILQSGTSQELARITSWIASSKRTGPQAQQQPMIFSGQEGFDSAQNNVAAPMNFSQFQSPREKSQFSDSEKNARRERRRERNRREQDRLNQASQPVKRSSRTPAPNRVVALHPRSSTHATSALPDKSWQYYLNLESDLVDAPSIGPKMASEFHAIGIKTISQFLSSSAASLAERIANQRVTEAVVGQWQEQAQLVCRIPNLRGHDAQLLVASNVSSPEQLARMNPTDLLAVVSQIANTREGQRIIRGGKVPDLAEVTDWITWSQYCRTLKAA